MKTITNKPRVITILSKLNKKTIKAIKAKYKYGCKKHLITVTDREGNKNKALPFETDDRFYLIKMTKEECQTFDAYVDQFEDSEDFLAVAS